MPLRLNESVFNGKDIEECIISMESHETALKERLLSMFLSRNISIHRPRRGFVMHVVWRRWRSRSRMLRSSYKPMTEVCPPVCRLLLVLYQTISIVDVRPSN